LYSPAIFELDEKTEQKDEQTSVLFHSSNVIALENDSVLFVLGNSMV